MSEYTIKTESLTAVITEHAAEMLSLKGTDGTERLWQGDPAYWAGRNPTLFPMVGSTWNKEVHIKDQVYVMGNHGFTRNSDFTCIEADDQHVVMELRDSEETLNQYPFHFILTNTYSVTDTSLTVHCKVENTNEEAMPFNFGFHPAFNVSNWDSAKIVFDKAETIDGIERNELSLDHEALAKTVIINQPRSSTYTLTEPGQALTITAPGFPWCAFWSPNAPFVCIEPWHSHADFEKVEVPFEKREGTIILPPHKSFETGYTITIA
ncbi:MAG: aldose 1-epimerase family protein [Solobacterium sp.]|nr:aldose 1-epimerase family protein [Solobacterium sp.]